MRRVRAVADRIRGLICLQNLGGALHEGPLRVFHLLHLLLPSLCTDVRMRSCVENPGPVANVDSAWTLTVDCFTARWQTIFIYSHGKLPDCILILSEQNPRSYSHASTRGCPRTPHWQIVFSKRQDVFLTWSGQKPRPYFDTARVEWQTLFTYGCLLYTSPSPRD